MAGATVDLDGPRLRVGAAAAAELELTTGRVREFRCGRAVQRDHLLAAGDVVRRVHAEVLARVFVDTQLEELADAGVATFVDIHLAVAVDIAGNRAVEAANDITERDHAVRRLAVRVLEQVDEVKALTRTEPAEVDDDVEALRDRLLRQDAALRAERAVASNGVLHDVAVVGNDVERDCRAAAVDERELHVAGDRAVQQAEAILAGADVEERLVLPVGQQLVAEEAALFEGIHPQLAGAIPGLVADHEVDVVIAVAPVERGAAREAQVHAVIEGFIAAVK